MLNESRCFQITEKISSNELIELLATSLVKDGKAKDSYLNAVQDRELEHPTGIDCGDYSIATPHTDSIHVNSSALAIAICNENVTFMNADKSGQELKPKIVVMMCIPESVGGEDHIKTIGRIYDIAGNPSVIESMCISETVDDIIKLFKEHF